MRSGSGKCNYPEMSVKRMPSELYATLLIIPTTVKSNRELWGCNDLNFPLSVNQ